MTGPGPLESSLNPVCVSVCVWASQSTHTPVCMHGIFTHIPFFLSLSYFLDNLLSCHMSDLSKTLIAIILPCQRRAALGWPWAATNSLADTRLLVLQGIPYHGQYRNIAVVAENDAYILSHGEE